MVDGRAATVVFDLDGVLYLDSMGVPGAGEALQSLDQAGVQLLFATNNSSKTPEDVSDHIRHRIGFATAPDQAVTSAGSAARYVGARHATALVVGSAALASMLEREGVDVVTGRREGAGSVVVGLDKSLTYDTIDTAARAIRNGSEFVATNIDSTYPTPTGLSPGAGSIVAAIAAASETAPINCGKPMPAFTDLVAAKVRGDTVWMVGDRPETDIAMAKSAGWTSVLTLTGVTSDASAVHADYQPDHVIASIVELPALLWESLGDGGIGR